MSNKIRISGPIESEGKDAQIQLRKVNRFCYWLEVLLVGKLPCRSCQNTSDYYLVKRRTDGDLVWYCRSCYPPARGRLVLGTYKRKLFRVHPSLIESAIGRRIGALGWEEWDPSASFELQLEVKLADLADDVS